MPHEELLMYRRKVALGAAAVAGLAATQIAFAEAPRAPRATAAQGGLAVTPAVLETTARRGASGSATITNSTGRKLKVTVRVRPWRQARSGAVAANRRRTLGGVSVNVSRFTMASGSQRTVTVSLNRVPSRGSQYGALEVVGKPTRKRKGINVAYRLISSLRFNPTSSARRLRLGAGKVRVTGRGSRRALVLETRNRGNTVDPVGGTVDVSGSAGGRSGAISSMRILPGKRVNLRLLSLSGMRKGSYRASITLSQRGKNQLSVTRSFRIRR
jgi:hypothetical protein